MTRRDCFTREHPPKSGDARRLWDWWIKHKGAPPDAIFVLRPGFWQRAAGVPHYSLQFGPTAYAIWSIEDMLKMDPADAERELLGHMHGDIYLE